MLVLLLLLLSVASATEIIKRPFLPEIKYALHLLAPAESKSQKREAYFSELNNFEMLFSNDMIPVLKDVSEGRRSAFRTISSLTYFFMYDRICSILPSKYQTQCHTLLQMQATWSLPAFYLQLRIPSMTTIPIKDFDHKVAVRSISKQTMEIINTIRMYGLRDKEAFADIIHIALQRMEISVNLNIEGHGEFRNFYLARRQYIKTLAKRLGITFKSVI